MLGVLFISMILPSLVLSETTKSVSVSSPEMTNNALSIETNTTIPSTQSITTQKTPTQASTGQPTDDSLLAIGFNVSIRQTFTSELNDPLSETYTHYETMFANTLHSVFKEMPGYSAVLISGFRNGSIVCDFYLQFSGASNLSETEYHFTMCISELKKSTVGNVVIVLDEQSMQQQYSAAAYSQMTGNYCKSCENGYVCSYRNGLGLCRHVCELVSDICQQRGGCLYDYITQTPTCRCAKDAQYDKSLGECEYGTEETNLAKFLGGILGSIGGLGIGTAVIWFFWNRKGDGAGSVSTGHIGSGNSCFNCHCRC